MGPPRRGAGATAFEIGAAMILAFGWFVYASVEAFLSTEPAPQEAFTDQHLLSVLWLELPMFAVASGFLQARGWRAHHLGLGSPWPWMASGLALAIISWTFASVVGLAFAVATSGAFHPDPYPVPPPPAELSWGAIVLVSILNPIYEEVFVAGYLITAVERWKGGLIAVVASSALRMSYHIDQGLPDAIEIFCLGLVFGAVYLKWRALWPLIIAHAVFDFVALGLV